MVETTALQAITTYGAGVISLAIIFAIILIVIKEFIPALKNIGETLAKTVLALGKSIDVLNETMLEMQRASCTAINALEKKINTLETKFDYHIKMAERIEF